MVLDCPAEPVKGHRCQGAITGAPRLGSGLDGARGWPCRAGRMGGCVARPPPSSWGPPVKPLKAAVDDDEQADYGDGEQAEHDHGSYLSGGAQYSYCLHHLKYSRNERGRQPRHGNWRPPLYPRSGYGGYRMELAGSVALFVFWPSISCAGLTYLSSMNLSRTALSAPAATFSAMRASRYLMPPPILVTSA